MQRLTVPAPTGAVGPATSVRERILASFYRPPAPAAPACSAPAWCPCRSGCAPAQQRGATRAAANKSSKQGGGFKGFGAPPKPSTKQERAPLAFDQDPAELEELAQSAAAANGGEEDGEERSISLKPAYQMYTDAGFKAQRFIGPIALRQPEGDPLPVLCATADLLPGDLLFVSPALGFVGGDFQVVPALEDLHAAMLEDGLPPHHRRVLDALDALRPGPRAAPPPPPAAAGPPAAPASPQQQGQQQGQQRAPASAPLPSLTALDPRFWAGRGRDASAPAFDARRLKRLLGRCAASYDTQDPAASQARHQKPLGHVALWPELPLLAHSCAPNTSQTVVADRLLAHLCEEVAAGAALTRNAIGPAVTAPLAVRQAAVAEALAEMGAPPPPPLPPLSVPQAAAAAAAASAGTGSEEGADADVAPPPTPESLLTACRCPRCVLEASVSEELRDTLEGAHNWFLNEASATFSAANEAEDEAMLRGLLADAETMVAEVEERVQAEPGLDDEQQDWLRASVYDVYDLLVVLDELLNQDTADPDYLQVCLDLIRVFAPGSDNHFMVALKLESLRRHRLDVFNNMLAREGGRSAAGPRGARSRLSPKAISKTDRRKLEALKEAVDRAVDYRFEALIMRYGYVSEEMLGQLTEGLEAYVEGLEQMGAMRAAGVDHLTRELEVEGVRVQIVDRLEVSDAARVGAAGGGNVRRLLQQDGMQLAVVEGPAAGGEEGEGVRGGAAARGGGEEGGDDDDVILLGDGDEEDVEEEGAGAFGEEGEEEGEVLDVEELGEEDIEALLDEAVQRALAEAEGARGGAKA